MLFYTATIFISFLIVVPIIILIHKLDSSINEDISDFSFDERLAETVGTSGQKYRVRPVNLDCAKSTIRLKQVAVRPIREEMPASNDKSIKIVAKEVPKIVTLESARKPLSQRGFAIYSLHSETVKKSIT